MLSPIVAEAVIIPERDIHFVRSRESAYNLQDLQPMLTVICHGESSFGEKHVL
jgi:hypothetical protein